MALYLLLDVLIAFLIDLVVGDPYWFPHPVRFIGWLIKRTEKFLRGRIEIKGYTCEERARAKRRAGAALMLIVTASTFIIVLILQSLAALIHPFVFHIVNIYFIYSALASKCLADEAKKVYDVLKTGDIVKSRESLSMLVGRETSNLSENEIIRGVVETTAENTVDGVISPLFYAIIGSLFGIGAPLVYAFKAVSTLDSMVGYMNDKYIDLGMVSAKTDDVANYIPARLSGILIPLGSWICGMGFANSFFIMLRDRRNHKSPNCAYSEAAVAGALGIMIGGTNIYFGRAVEKPTIGDASRDINIDDIPRTIRLMYVSAVLTLIFGLAIGMAALKLLVY